MTSACDVSQCDWRRVMKSWRGVMASLMKWTVDRSKRLLPYTDMSCRWEEMKRYTFQHQPQNYIFFSMSLYYAVNLALVMPSQNRKPKSTTGFELPEVKNLVLDKFAPRFAISNMRSYWGYDVIGHSDRWRHNAKVAAAEYVSISLVAVGPSKTRNPMTIREIVYLGFLLQPTRLCNKKTWLTTPTVCSPK